MPQRVEEGAAFFGLYFLREAADARARDRVDEFSLGERGLHELGDFVGHGVERPAEVDGVVRVVVDVEVLPADLPRLFYRRRGDRRDFNVGRQYLADALLEGGHQLALVEAHRPLLYEVEQHPPGVGRAEELAARVPELEGTQREEVAARLRVGLYVDVAAFLRRVFFKLDAVLAQHPGDVVLERLAHGEAVFRRVGVGHLLEHLEQHGELDSPARVYAAEWNGEVELSHRGSCRSSPVCRRRACLCRRSRR